MSVLLDDVQGVLLLVLLALLVNGIAYAMKFYELHERKPSSLHFTQVGIVFAIYLSCSFIVPVILAPMQRLLPSTLFFGGVQLIKLSVIAALLYFYLKTVPGIRAIWKDSPSSIAHDFGIGVLTWFISFPAAAALGHLFDTLLKYFWSGAVYEQNAVQFLKLMTASPVTFVIALISILIAAPVIEELMFRGFLQSWLRPRLGTKAAILISALCFALFHFAATQSYGNLSIIVTLFGFSCFLGFIYERQGSLYASIGLHMAFNTASVLRIVFGLE